MTNYDGARLKRNASRNPGNSRGRVIYGVFVVLLVLFGIGTTVLNAVSWSDADDAANAPVCATAEQTDIGADCITWTTAKIVSFVNTGGKNSHHSLTVADITPGDAFPDSQQIDFQGGNALLADDRIGTTVQVETWENKQIVVKAGSLVVETEDNPLVGRTDLTAGAMICFGLGSFLMVMTFGVDGGGVVSQDSFSASSFLRRRRSPGGDTAVVRIPVICWSVVATVAGFAMVVRSLTVSATFTVAVGVTEAVDLLALVFLAVSAYAQARARKRAAAGLYT